jgi:glycosyltransferase involved in cell wall biosynthesis
MTNVLIVVSYFSKSKYDPGDFITDLAKGLLNKGHIVHVIAPHANGLKFREEIFNLNVLRFSYFYPHRFQKLAYGGGIPYNIQHSMLAKIQTIFFILFELSCTIRTVKSSEIDIINSHWLIPQGFIGAICKKYLNIPHISTLHSSEITILRKLPAGKLIAEFIVSNSDILVSVSEHRANELLNFISVNSRISVKNKIRIIPMGVYTKDFHPSNKAQPSDLYKTNSTIFRILFVGRLVEVKGCEHIIKALELVLKRINNIELIIVGAGPLEFKLKELVASLGLQGYVKFEGFVEHSKIHRYYLSSDVLVFPSVVDSEGYEEGLPVVLIEALASGLPIVAGITKGITEIIEDKFNGILVDPTNHIKFSNCLIRILEDEHLRKKLSNNAIKTGKLYDWSIIIKKYSDIIEEVFHV